MEINMKKSLFKASFEQSLNLLDVPIYNVLGDDFKSRQITSKRVKGISLIIVFGFLFVISFLSKKSNHFNHSYNFLPMWLFVLTVIIYSLVVFYTIKKEYGLLKKYSQFLRIDILMVISIIYTILFVIQAFLNKIPIYLFVIGFILVIITTFLMIRHKLKHFYSVLYNDDKETHNNMIKYYKIFGIFFYTVLPILLIIYYLFKWFKPDILVLLGIKTSRFTNGFLVSIPLIIVMIAMVVYKMWPDLMIGYYKYKYSEEYRVFEGKSKEEWYGEKDNDASTSK